MWETYIQLNSEKWDVGDLFAFDKRNNNNKSERERERERDDYDADAVAVVSVTPTLWWEGWCRRFQWRPHTALAQK